jgi:linoleate 10R-lipoxygenase
MQHLQIISQALLAVFSFPDIARAPKQSGTLKRYQDDSYPELEFAYLENGKFSTPWPNSMCIQVK